MEQVSKIPQTKGKKRLKQSTKQNKVNNISGLRKVRTKNSRKTIESNLMIQLHHFANVTKSTTATKAATLNLTGESKALLENDYFKIIHAKQPKNTEFIAKPFLINESAEIDADLGDKIRCSASHHTNVTSNITKHFCHTKREFKDLVATKLKAKRITRSPLADACRNINSMISIKDYHRVYCKQIFESRLFINGLLVYDHLKRHYSGVSVARNCFKKKFINKLEKATRESFPEMETFKTTTNHKENRLLQNVMEYYENQETDVKLFNEQIQRIEENVKKKPLVDDLPPESSITAVSDYPSPDSFGTPPSQRLHPVDVSTAKYQTVFYEKDAKSGKTSLFELPRDFTVTGKNVDKVNCCDLKRIDLLNDDRGASCSKPYKRPNDLALICDRKRQKSAKKRLFQDVVDENANIAIADDDVFVRPVYSPREFTAFKRKRLMLSPPDYAAKQPHLQTLQVVDELDCLKNVAKIKTPEHRYYPFVQFTRE